MAQKEPEAKITAPTDTMLDRPDLGHYVLTEVGSNEVITDGDSLQSAVKRAEDEGYDRSDFTVRFNLKDDLWFV